MLFYYRNKHFYVRERDLVHSGQAPVASVSSSGEKTCHPLKVITVGDGNMSAQKSRWQQRSPHQMVAVMSDVVAISIMTIIIAILEFISVFIPTCILKGNSHIDTLKLGHVESRSYAA